MHERLRDILLERWARLVITRPRRVLLLCLLLAAGSVTLAVQQLEFRSDRSELIDPDLEWNRRYTEYRQAFPHWDDLVVVLDAAPDNRAIDALTERLAAALTALPEVHRARGGIDPNTVNPALFALLPPDAFERRLTELAVLRAFAAQPDATSALAIALQTHRNLLEAAGAARTGKAGGAGGAGENLPTPGGDLASSGTALSETGEAGTARLLRPFLAAAHGKPITFDGLVEENWIPLRDPGGSGRLRFLLVSLAESGDHGGIDSVAAGLTAVRACLTDEIRRFGASPAELTWGVTGIPAIESDETRQSIADSTLASLLAFGLITALMLAVFRGVVVPLIAAASVVVGIAWSFGWLVLAVGHLQLLSVVFTVILLGLGVDFALHLLARLELVAAEEPDLETAMVHVFREVGPGLMTGAITTAAAFGCTALTEFLGMAEMGMISAGGILLCLLAVLFVLPAALALSGRWPQSIRIRGGRAGGGAEETDGAGKTGGAEAARRARGTAGTSATFARGWLDWTDTSPRRALIAACLLMAAIALPGLGVSYDPNVLNLHPPEIESVLWEHRVVADNDRSAWAGVVLCSPEAAADLTDRLLALDEVAAVGGMGLLAPIDRQDRTRRIADLRARPLLASPLPASPAKPAADPGRLAALLTALAPHLSGESGAGGDSGSAAPHSEPDLQLACRRAAAALRAASADDAEQRLTALNTAWTTARGRFAALAERALSPRPLTAADLPPVLRERWTSGNSGDNPNSNPNGDPNGNPSNDLWLLLVEPAADAAGRPVLHPARLGPFVEAVRSVAPAVLGPPVQIYESTRLIIREYLRAAGLAIAAILLLLLLDFRSLADALCALVPVAAGFLGMFGVMAVTGVPLNFANIIVMPLIFGIGVDSGVHIVHRWRREPSGRPAGLSGGTGRGVTLTLTTTIVGFGCMLLAEHRGIRSLGQAMVAGLAVTQLACWLLLPPLLRLRTSSGNPPPVGPLQAAATTSVRSDS